MSCAAMRCVWAMLMVMREIIALLSRVSANVMTFFLFPSTVSFFGCVVLFLYILFLCFVFIVSLYRLSTLLSSSACIFCCFSFLCSADVHVKGFWAFASDHGTKFSWFLCGACSKPEFGSANSEDTQYGRGSTWDRVGVTVTFRVGDWLGSGIGG